MTIDDIVNLAAKARAQELIKQIESGELTYDEAVASLRV